MASIPNSGLMQYLYLNTATPATLGWLVGGNLDRDGKLTEVKAVQGGDEWRGDVLEPQLNFDLEPTNTTIFDYLVRDETATGYPAVYPTLFPVVGGNNDYALTMATAYVNKWSLDIAVKQNLKLAGVQIIGLDQARGTPPTTIPALDAVTGKFRWYKAGVTIGGSTYLTTSVKLAYECGIQAFGSLDAGTTGSLRLPDHSIVGYDMLSGEVEVVLDTALDPWTDEPSLMGDLALSVTQSTTTSPATKTFTVYQPLLQSVKEPLKIGAEKVVRTLSFKCAANLRNLSSPDTVGLIIT